MDAAVATDADQAHSEAPVQAPAQHPATMVMAIVGRALRPAEVLICDANKHVDLVVLFEQDNTHHPHAYPILARWQWPNEIELSVAALYERAMKRATLIHTGADVVARGHGIALCSYRKSPVLRLVGCDGIDLAPSIPSP